jgi:hypothetical protein
VHAAVEVVLDQVDEKETPVILEVLVMLDQKETVEQQDLQENQDEQENKEELVTQVKMAEMENQE